MHPICLVQKQIENDFRRMCWKSFFVKLRLAGADQTGVVRDNNIKSAFKKS